MNQGFSSAAILLLNMRFVAFPVRGTNSAGKLEKRSRETNDNSVYSSWHILDHFKDKLFLLIFNLMSLKSP